MGWQGKFFGALIGFLATRSVWGAIIGLIIGYVLDQGASARRAAGTGPDGDAASTVGIPQVFFRTTFELMGHVAKSDGRVSEAEIEAARRLMRQLNLGPSEVNLAIAFFRAGKSPAYNVDLGIERLRDACGMRHDLLRAFLEFQLRAALAGNDLSPPARAILTRVAERLGLSALDFARLEASLRGRERSAGIHAMADSYAELEVESSASDQDVTMAYRRQMSRHHPDKLVANGLPESMAQVAKEKTQRIQEAYEAIRAARGMR
jgi:DnaJ like chaperone protein